MTLSQLILDFVRRHALAYASAGLMLIGIALLTVWLPRQIGHMVDALVAGSLRGPLLWHEAAWLVAAGLGIYLLRVGWRLRLYGATYQFGVELRTRLYERLTLQGPRFYQQQRTGNLMALATNDVDAVEMAAGEAMLAGFDGSLTMLLVIAAMAVGVDWRLALVALLPFPFMALAFWWISRNLHDSAQLALKQFAALNDLVQESITGVRTLKSLGLQQRTQARFALAAGAAADSGLAAQRWEAAYEPAVGLALTAATTLALGMGGWLVWQNQITVGQLTSFGLYLGQLIWPMFAAGWVLSLIERGRAAWGRLGPVLQAPLSTDDLGSIDTVAGLALRGRALDFTYPGQTGRALSEVQFDLPAGQTLGLVGPTGSGKSTLLALMLRQWTPERGSLTLGGQQLSDHSQAALRQSMAWVPQEAFLFSASVAENIALGRPHASAAEIERVAIQAAVHDDIIRLPQGYATPVGERGVSLSGGQRQRVAIARALLAGAPLLLLDDALSAVDTETEAQILSALREQRQSRSVVIVSHRLSALADVDQILVLRQGRVVERGTHDELLAAGHWYATQWRVQQLEQSLAQDDQA